jgi:hypothetical protein
VIDVTNTNGNAAAAVEGNDLVFAVTQSQESSADTTAEWSITVPAVGAPGTASYADFDASQFAANGINVSGPDGQGNYTLSGTVTIPAGSQTGEIRIPTYDDAIFEGDEGLSLSLSNVTGGAQLPGGVSNISYDGTIIDNETPPVVDVTNTNGNAAAAVEGNDLVFALTQSEASSADTTADWSITVPAAGAPGTASYADFDATQFAAKGITATNNGNGTYTLSGSVTIPAGSTSANITIPTYDDVIFEGDEALSLTLSNVTGGAQLPNGASNVSYNGTIIDNEINPPVISVPLTGNGVVAVEGANLVFPVEQSIASAYDTTVDWSITVPATGAPARRATRTLTRASSRPTASRFPVLTARAITPCPAQRSFRRVRPARTSSFRPMTTRSLKGTRP